MTDSTIFSGQQEDKPVVAAPTETKDQGLLSALVGETQKYKSAEELAKAYVNADSFIEQLKEENRKLREQAASAKTVDEVLERMQQKPAEQKDTSASLSKEDIAALVEQTLTGRETAKTKETNLLKADRLMKEKFGEKAAEVFKAKASNPQLAKVYMELASVDPDQFVGLFASQPQAGLSVDNASVASIPTQRVGSNVEWSKEWVKEVRKKDPNRYYSVEFQNSLLKNANRYFST